jgi:hypothetical protein
MQQGHANEQGQCTQIQRGPVNPTNLTNVNRGGLKLRQKNH